MKSTLALLMAFALMALSAPAATLNPAGDTYSTLTYSTGKNPVVTKRFTTNAAGKTANLYVSKTHSAFVKFDAAAQLAGATVTGAKLTLYFPLATKPGKLDVSVVSSSWTEAFTGATAPEPGYTAAFAEILATSVVAKRFVVIDVTPEVQAWVSGAVPDNGFAITSPDAIANVLLGAKEGPGSGYPATLEVDVDNVSGGPVLASTAAFTGTVAIGTNNPDTRFPLTLQGQPVVLSGVPNGNTTLMMMEDGGGSEKWHLQLEGASGKLGFTETGVADDRFVLAPGGNVGIGTGDPAARLEVNGDAKVDGVVTATAVAADGSALTNLSGANIANGTVGNAPLGLCKISGLVKCNNTDPTHTFVYVRGTNALAYVGDLTVNGYPFQLTLMEPGTYTLVARSSSGSEAATQVTVAAGQTLTGLNLMPVNLMTDASNCGGCGNVCPVRSNGAAACASGACAIACNAGFADCNGVPGDGCEVNITTSASNCGGCGVVCQTRPNSSPTCTSGMCTLACNAGFGNCDGNPVNGCETNTNTSNNNCGGCGVVCPGTKSCISGTCQ